MSRNSRNRGRKSRKQSSLIGRSASQASNASLLPQNDRPSQLPSNQSESDTQSEEDESIFKFSSASSIDHLHDSSQDINGIKRGVRKKNSFSSGLHSPKLHVSESGSKIHGSRTFSNGGIGGDRHNIKSDQNKALVRKLELMHNFTTEAVKLLRTEDEHLLKHDGHVSQQYLFRALEENHEELRRLLLKRLKPRPQRNSIASVPIGSPATTACPNTAGEVSDTNPFDFDYNESIIRVNPAMDDHNKETSDDNEEGCADEYYYDEKSQEEPTVMYNDNLSVQEDSTVSPLDHDDEPLEQDISKVEAIEETEATPFDLATIEEQPELGYTSESESSLELKDLASSGLTPTPLEPLPEEDTKLLEEISDHAKEN